MTINAVDFWYYEKFCEKCHCIRICSVKTALISFTAVEMMSKTNK